jgi:predicted AAA+ superfamily ATPase
MNRQNYTLFDYLYASAYGSSISQLKLSEEDFENYFVETNAFQNTSNKLENCFRLCKKATPLFICLHGYAGTGKTTFLHWYLKKKSQETAKYNKLIFNFIDEKESPNGEQ